MDSKKQKTYTIAILLKVFAYLSLFAAGFVLTKDDIHALYIFVLGVYFVEKSDHYKLLYTIDKGDKV